jgi:hypothetical protein
MPVWGHTDWVLSHLNGESWALLGSLSTEERALYAPRLLRKRVALSSAQMLRIAPPPTHPSLDTFLHSLDRQLDSYLASGGSIEDVRDCSLMGLNGDIVSLAQDFSASGESLMIDITAMTKRFFFPIIRFALEGGARNIVAAYTLPSQYGQGPLHEDVDPASYLPAFMPADIDEGSEPALVVAVGFESPGLTQILESDQGNSVTFLVPFPAGPPFHGEAWDSLRSLTVATDPRITSIVPVSATDVPAAFQRLEVVSAVGRRPTVLAPYGPKPVSLAMCLFALTSGRSTATVRYAQPKHYSASYSSGVASVGDTVTSLAYPLRIDGRDVYRGGGM